MQLMLMKQNKKERRLKIGISLSNSSQQNHSLKESFNVTYTDYCSLRTKKKLETLIEKHELRQSKNMTTNANKTKKWQNLLTIISKNNVSECANLSVLEREKKLVQITKGKEMSETQINRDWLNQKIMQLEFLQSQYIEANGHKVMLEKNIRRQNSPSRRYYTKSLASETEKEIPAPYPLLNSRKRKTLFSKTVYKPQQQFRTQPESVLNGWQSEVREYL